MFCRISRLIHIYTKPRSKQNLIMLTASSRRTEYIYRHRMTHEVVTHLKLAKYRNSDCKLEKK